MYSIMTIAYTYHQIQLTNPCLHNSGGSIGGMELQHQPLLWLNNV